MRTTADIDSGPIRCSGCSNSTDATQEEQLFEDADSLWEHISMVHARWIPFECTRCPKIFLPSEAMLKHHYQLIHPGNVPEAVYSFEEEKKLLTREIFLKSQKLSNTPCSGSISRSKTTSTPVQRNNPTTSVMESLNLHVETSFTTPLKEEENSEMDETKPAAEVVNKIVKPTKSPNTNPKAPWCHLCKRKANVLDKGRHIWRFHIATRRFSCNECDFTTPNTKKMKSHAEYQHRRQSGIWWTDHTKELMPQYDRQFTLAFGKHISSKRLNCRPLSPLNVVKGSGSDCKLCARPVCRMQRGRHIWQYHMPEMRFSCHRCSEYRCSFLAAMKRHTKLVHKVHLTDENDVSWVDNTKALSKQYETTFVSAFGS